MLLSHKNIVAPKEWEHDPAMYGDYRYTVAMCLAE